jgi:hypothetical protein
VNRVLVQMRTGGIIVGILMKKNAAKEMQRRNAGGAVFTAETQRREVPQSRDASRLVLSAKLWQLCGSAVNSASQLTPPLSSLRLTYYNESSKFNF